MYNKKISVQHSLHTVVNFKEVFNLDKSARVLEISNDNGLSITHANVCIHTALVEQLVYSSFNTNEN